MPNSFAPFQITWGMIKKATGSVSGMLNPNQAVYVQTGEGTLLPQIFDEIGSNVYLTCESAASGGYEGYFGLWNKGGEVGGYIITWQRIAAS